MERDRTSSADSASSPGQVSARRTFGRCSDSLSGISDQVVPSRITSTRSSSESVRSKELIEKWKSAAKKCTPDYMPDPWEQFNIIELPTQNCIRHCYSSIRKQWSQDRVQIKMHPESFARGAMRECYRVKKLSSLWKNDNWAHAQNYVAKKYIRPVDRQVVFEDVKLQMDSKLWAEEFNRYNPPKKIDIMQACVLEFIDEPGHPLYHLEHYIEGDYIKYNSNSGFVSDIARKTPQAFSHFTFERSGHQMIIVDIQGVGDLYTDPQIHTASGEGYGDGNLGTKGMALFFHSHACNEICYSMCLTQFDLWESESRALKSRRTSNEDGSTLFVNSDLLDICEPLTTDDDTESAMEKLRRRTLSMNNSGLIAHSSVSYEGLAENGSATHSDNCVCERCVDRMMAKRVRRMAQRSDTESASIITDPNEEENRAISMERCMSVESTSSCCSSRFMREAEKEAFWSEARKLSRPAGCLSPAEMQQLAELARLSHVSPVLGQVHLDLARYHELGRFLPKSVSASKNGIFMLTVENGNSVGDCSFTYDKEAALYHLDLARRWGILEAIITIAQIAYGLPHELLKDVNNSDYWGCDDPEAMGIELMETAADMGDQSAMLFVAESYTTGRRLGASGSPNWPKAIEWYSKAANLSENSDDANECSMTTPKYEIYQKMAEMYKEGGYGLEQDFKKAYDLFTEAAEIAMEAMQGRLANKLYELAEQCAV